MLTPRLRDASRSARSRWGARAHSESIGGIGNDRIPDRDGVRTGRVGPRRGGSGRVRATEEASGGKTDTGVKVAEAKSAADFGGMDKLVEAAKAEVSSM